MKTEMKKKIYENDIKIRIVIAVALISLLTYRILMFFVDDSYISAMVKAREFQFTTYAPYLVMVIELFSVFYKGRVTAFLSIINIILSIVAVIINGIILAISLFAMLVQGSIAGIPEVIIEIVMNILLCIGAGALLILNEQNELNNRFDVDNKLPLTKRIWKMIKHVWRIMKDNKKSIAIILKILLSAGLSLLLISRIRTAFEEYSFTGSFYQGRQYIFAIVPFLVILSEIVSLFLKGKPAVAVRIANIIAAGGMVIIEGLIIGLVLFAAVWGYISGDFSFYLGEFFENIVLLITALGIGIGGLFFKEKSRKTKM